MDRNSNSFAEVQIHLTHLAADLVGREKNTTWIGNQKPREWLGGYPWGVMKVRLGEYFGCGNFWLNCEVFLFGYLLESDPDSYECSCR